MEVVIGVIVREVDEVLQPHPVCRGQGQIGILRQNGAHIRGGALGQVDAGVLVKGSGPAHGPPLRPVRVRRKAGAVVEELEEIDVLRPFIGGGEELVADVEALAVEERLIEIPQLVAGEGAVGLAAAGFLRRFGGRPGEGGGADHRRDGQHREQRRAQVAAVLRDAGDPLFQLLLSRRHGGGGQQGIGGSPPHGDQGEERFSIGDALPLAQP